MAAEQIGYNTIMRAADSKRYASPVLRFQ